MNNLKIESLLMVFDSLDIEERQRLIPTLTLKAGIITRDNVKDVEDKKEREFINFIFNQTLYSVLKYQYIERCRTFLEEVKNNTVGGTMTYYDDKIYIYLYGTESEDKDKCFLNFLSKEISKEHFFKMLLEKNNNIFKHVGMPGTGLRFLGDVLYDL
jgi:hypothetical protein